MKRGLVIGISIFFLAGFVGGGTVWAADAPATGPTVIGKEGGTVLKAEPAPVKTLKGRVWAQWADNPEREVLFGIQYWNTGEPASGTPLGRASMIDVNPPDPLFVCCAWGFTGGTDKNNPYAGWYHAQTTVRLLVKDKALMDQLIKTSQELTAMEVTLDGRTITGFKVITPE